MTFSETVKRVIELANAIEDYWNAELPKRHPTYPIIGPGEGSVPPPPEEDELRALLKSLPPDDVYKLLALNDVGRRLLPPRDLDVGMRQMQERYPDLEDTIELIAETQSRISFLPDALELLASLGLDLDQLPLVHA